MFKIAILAPLAALTIAACASAPVESPTPTEVDLWVIIYDHRPFDLYEPYAGDEEQWQGSCMTENSWVYKNDLPYPAYVLRDADGTIVAAGDGPQLAIHGQEFVADACRLVIELEAVPTSTFYTLELTGPNGYSWEKTYQVTGDGQELWADI